MPMKAPDQDARDRAIEEKQQSLLVQAGAGSGKTTTLMLRLARILAEEGASLSRVVAITFTEKAAEELKARLRALCDEKLAETGDARWRRHRQAVETAHIGTIHGFCSRLLRVHALGIGLDPRFTVMEEAAGSLLLRDAMRGYLLQSLRAGSPPAQALVAALGLDQAARALAAVAPIRGRPVLEGLPTSEAGVRARWTQALAVHAEWELARLRDDAEVAQAARGLRETAPVDADNALAQKRERVLDLLGVALDLAAPPDGATAAWAEIAALDLRGSYGGAKSWPPDGVQTVKDALKILRDTGRNVQYLAAGSSPVTDRAAVLTAHFCAILPEALEAYAAAKREQGALDFDDLLVLARDLLRDHPEVRRLEQDRFDHILVDEFQDTDPIQREVIWYLAEAGVAAAPADVQLRPGKLFVVGDAKQSIYLFRGADVTVYDRTQREFEGDPACDTVPLTANFRSQSRLVSFFNQVFACPDVMGRDDARRRPFEAVYEPLQATRGAPAGGPDVSFILAVGEDESIDDLRVRAADGIARYIAGAVQEKTVEVGEKGESDTDTWRPAEWRDFMVLLPTMTGVHLYERALHAHAVPYYVVSGRGFYGRPEVLDVTSLLRVLEEPRDEIALARVLRSPCFCVSDEGLYWLAREGGLANGLDRLGTDELGEGSPLANLSPTDRDRSRCAAGILSELRGLRHRLPLSELIGRALDATGLPAVVAARFDGQRAYANLQKLIEVAREFQTGESSSLGRFIEYVETLRAEEIREGEAPAQEEQGNTVTLMTVHKAKGLEKPVVVVADLSGDQDRSSRAPVIVHPEAGPVMPGETDEGKRELPPVGEAARHDLRDRDAAEKKRLLYVALTRACDHLVISAPIKVRKDGTPRTGVYLDALFGALGDQMIDGDAPLGTSGPGDWSAEVVLVGEPAASGWAAPGVTSLLGRHSRQIAAGDPLPGGDSAIEDGILRRLAPIAPDLAAKTRFTVTELTSYRRCPRSYELRYVRQLAGHAPSGERAVEGALKPFERGNVVHRALQRLGRGPAAGLRGLVEASVRECGLAGHDPREVHSIVETLSRFTRSETWRRIEAAQELRSEVPVVARFEAGLLEGQVDALIRDREGRLHLLDYKTGRAGDAGTEAEHLFQVGAYAAALAQRGAEALASVTVHYLADSKRLEVAASVAAEEATRQLEGAMQGIRNSAFAPSPKCDPDTCPYGWLCRSHRG